LCSLRIEEIGTFKNGSACISQRRRKVPANVKAEKPRKEVDLRISRRMHQYVYRRNACAKGSLSASQPNNRNGVRHHPRHFAVSDAPSGSGFSLDDDAVELASSGSPILPNHVYVLPSGKR
jgi:hypothetical protein